MSPLIPIRLIMGSDSKSKEYKKTAKSKYFTNNIKPIDFTTNPERALQWPDHAMFPLNISGGRRVKDILNNDIKASTDYLIVTGFTSLGHILETFGADIWSKKLESVRIVFGWDPYPTQKKRFPSVDLSTQAKNYWYENGYSILSGAGGYVIGIIELIQQGKLDFRLYYQSSKRLHAKIYVGDEYAVIGSSNFSQTGLTSQLEANIRVSEKHNPIEKQQYESAKQIAENYFALGVDFNSVIIDLLKELLAPVTWQEALARAINELIFHNTLYEQFPQLRNKLTSLSLWPIQLAGLQQAFQIIQTQGCVLIADPTGSGKTAMTTALHLLLLNWLWESGRRFQTHSVTVAPSSVADDWNFEFERIAFAHNSFQAMGILSQKHHLAHAHAQKRLENANVLLVDEAHNYLSRKSFRSLLLDNNQADFVILSTATPISRHVRDLLRIIELLGLDNLTDREISAYKALRRQRMLSLKRLPLLQEFVSRILVRRTKPLIKAQIIASHARHLTGQGPLEYKDRNGQKCAYPIAHTRTYEVSSSVHDDLIAEQINKLSADLVGVIYLWKLRMPVHIEDLAAYVDNRIQLAGYLSRYQLQASMRSSKAALLEHIYGTQYAINALGNFFCKKPHSGNVLDVLTQSMKTGSQCDLPDEVLPDWLQNGSIDEFSVVCKREIAIYTQIGQLAHQLQGSRDQAKINQISRCVATEGEQYVVAFDSKPITLFYFKHLMTNVVDSSNVIYVVTGGTSKKATKYFRNTAREYHTQEKAVLLCSDAVSESIGLQRASILIFLDLPSVLRLAEQRIGRLDRLDSLHPEITIFWPHDTKPFRLKADLNLIKTHEHVRILLGSNFTLPKYDANSGQLIPEEITPERYETLLKEFENENASWPGIRDAFADVHELYEGSDPLIDSNYLETLKEVTAKIKVTVRFSAVASNKRWCFLAFRATVNHPPAWYFITGEQKVESDLNQICIKLRSQLKEADSLTSSRPTPQDWDLVNHYLKVISQKRFDLLPNKKSRALRVAKKLLQRQSLDESDESIRESIKTLLSAFNASPVWLEDKLYEINFMGLAELWIEFFKPHVAYLKQQYPRKVITTNDLLDDTLITLTFTYDELDTLLTKVEYQEPLSAQLAAVILSDPNYKSSAPSKNLCN